MGENESGATNVAGKPPKETVSEKAARAISKLLLRSSAGRIAGLFLFMLLTAVGAVALWYVWFRIVPGMWGWSLQAWWQFVPGILAIYLVGFFALALPALPGWGFLWVVGMFAEVEQEEIKRSLERASRHLERTETELEKNDTSGLVALVRYSREQLKSYYEIGLSQTHRSFRYSVVAMWIGFFIIVSGIVISVFPLETVFGITLVRTEIETLVLAGGGIIEVISALFLWVYRSSISQLTYFYNRQIHTHSILMCNQIASSMDEPDATKQIIVEKVLERTWTAERPGEPRSGVIAKMFSK